jgi:hypothetical protein
MKYKTKGIGRETYGPQFEPPAENSGFECREKGCVRDALVGSYYCRKHDKVSHV